MFEDELVKIVGERNMSRELAAREEFCKDESFANTVMPEWVARPKDGEEVRRIVALANETLTPLVPVSSGPPHFRGDTVPGEGGSLIVDLGRMKKIMLLDRRYRVAVCEPGTTFAELIPAVREAGLKLNMPLLPRRSKSVVGSLLEREPVIMPAHHWDGADPLNCVEVVFGTGDTFRTGSAAGPGSLEEQQTAGLVPNQPEGPSQASLHRIVQGAQGTMGIVTWASMRCELLPALEEAFLSDDARLDGLLEFAHWLIRLRLVNECFIVNNVNLAAITAERGGHEYAKLKGDLPKWILFFSVAGYNGYMPEEKMEYQTKDILDLSRRLGVTTKKAIGDVSASTLMEMVQQPSVDPYWKLRPRGSCHDIFFLTIYRKLPGLIGAMIDHAVEAGYPPSDMGIYLQPAVQGSNCHCEFNLFFDPNSARERQTVRTLAGKAVTGLMDKGAFFSRPYGEYARTVLNRDEATAAALRKVKAVFDPKNILNPGRLCF
jgi:FAD/FMN-containing dehydrogenase